MKKIICLLLALVLCTLLFAACDKNTEDTKPNAKEITIEGITEFSGVALTGWQNGGKEVMVEVCEEYKEILGDTVKVVTYDLLDLAMGKGTEVSVVIDKVYDTTPLTIYVSDIDAWMVDDPPPIDPGPVFDKPVIYLYPEADTECNVKVTMKNGELTCTYPEHGTDGWQNFTARPDGTLVFPDGKEYYCLYWEGVSQVEFDFTKGFCVKGSDTAEFLDKILPQTGLNAREANEFIIYWLPILQKNAYNLISFQTDAYTSTAELEITPTPDSLLRVYMAAKALDAPIEIEVQTFKSFTRSGFTVVEWGGSIVAE